MLTLHFNTREEGESRYVDLMDASLLSSAVLVVLFSAIFFYVLFGVVRAAVREGIRHAWQARADDLALKGESH